MLLRYLGIPVFLLLCRFLVPASSSAQTCNDKIISDINYMLSGIQYTKTPELWKLLNAVLIRTNARQRYLAVRMRGCKSGSVPRHPTFDKFFRTTLRPFLDNIHTDSKDLVFRMSRVAIIISIHFETLLCAGFRMSKLDEYMQTTNTKPEQVLKLLMRHYRRDLTYGGVKESQISHFNKYQCIHYSEIEFIMLQIWRETSEDRHIHKQTKKNANAIFSLKPLTNDKSINENYTITHHVDSQQTHNMSSQKKNTIYFNHGNNFTDISADERKDVFYTQLLVDINVLLSKIKSMLAKPTPASSLNPTTLSQSDVSRYIANFSSASLAAQKGMQVTAATYMKDFSITRHHSKHTPRHYRTTHHRVTHYPHTRVSHHSLHHKTENPTASTLHPKHHVHNHKTKIPMTATPETLVPILHSTLHRKYHGHSHSTVSPETKSTISHKSRRPSSTVPQGSTLKYNEMVDSTVNLSVQRQNSPTNPSAQHTKYDQSEKEKTPASPTSTLYPPHYHRLHHINQALIKPWPSKVEKFAVFSLILVDIILRGYIIQDENLPCPADVLHDLAYELNSHKHSHSSVVSMEAIGKVIERLHLAHVTSSASHDGHIQASHASHANERAGRSDSHGVHDSSHNVHDFSHSLHGPSHGVHEPNHGVHEPNHGVHDPCSTYLLHEFNISKSPVDVSTARERDAYNSSVYTFANFNKIYFGSRKHKNLSPLDLLDICPGILMTILTSKGNEETPILSPFSSEVYGLASLCVFVISLCSLLGAVLVKVSHTRLKQYAMAALLAMSISCLLGDAFIHLLPTVLHIHVDIHHDDGFHIPDHMTKIFAVVLSFYIFILLELLFVRFESHSHDHETEIIIPIKKKTRKSGKKNNVELDTIRNNIFPRKNIDKEIELQKNQSENQEDKENREVIRMSSAESQTDLVEDEIRSESCSSETHSNATNTMERRSLILMIVFGDAIHNFADGLAIGAAFAQNLTEGLSTCIAVLCHELPHELGDFAVLLNSGMTVKKALLLNSLSAIPAFMGLYIGIGAGASHNTRVWILAAGTGMFIYVALAKLIPEMLRTYRQTSTLAMFVALNVGLLVGFASMFLLAVYEHDIRW